MRIDEQHPTAGDAANVFFILDLKFRSPAVGFHIPRRRIGEPFNGVQFR